MQSVKVVITGPFNVGKSTFIKAVSEITVLSTERKVRDTSEKGGGETTVAMDFGRITISDDVVLYLFGTPGQERFSFMWDTLSEGMLGFVMLVDGTDNQSMSDAKEMIAFLKEMTDIPYVVAANMVDEEDTSTLEYVRSSLDLDESVPMLACDAREKESVKSILLGLMYRILET